MKKEFTNLANIDQYFTNEKKCLKHFETIRWGKTPACTSCGSVNPYKLKDGKNYKCRECKKFFNALTGTIFENTKIPLIKWFKAIYIFTSHKKGISSIQLGKDLGITQKSAWFMLGRLRQLLADRAPQLLYGMVEADETYIGGKISNQHKSKRDKNKKKFSPVSGKTPVFGLLQRDGKVYTRVIQQPTRPIVSDMILGKVQKESKLITDASSFYPQLANDYDHHIINHQKDEFVRGSIHTNSMEGYWSLLKRGINGIYHQVSPKHLQRYCDEFAFRYNTRKKTEVERFDNALGQCEDSRLKYGDLIGKGKK